MLCLTAANESYATSIKLEGAVQPLREIIEKGNPKQVKYAKDCLSNLGIKAE